MFIKQSDQRAVAASADKLNILYWHDFTLVGRERQRAQSYLFLIHHELTIEEMFQATASMRRAGEVNVTALGQGIECPRATKHQLLSFYDLN